MTAARMYAPAGLAAFTTVSLLALPMSSARTQTPTLIPLPPPATRGSTSVEEALHARRSVRAFRDERISLEQVGQLLWAAQGITSSDGYRTAPSAGARYPIEVYVAVGRVGDLPPGVYRYRPPEHALVRHADGDRRRQLGDAAVEQAWMAQAPAIVAITSVDRRTRARYGERTERYVAIETGHVGQNVYLQAVALGLGTVMVGAFHDDRVAAILELGRGERPVALMPVGKPGG